MWRQNNFCCRKVPKATKRAERWRKRPRKLYIFLAKKKEILKRQGKTMRAGTRNYFFFFTWPNTGIKAGHLTKMSPSLHAPRKWRPMAKENKQRTMILCGCSPISDSELSLYIYIYGTLTPSYKSGKKGGKVSGPYHGLQVSLHYVYICNM